MATRKSRRTHKAKRRLTLKKRTRKGTRHGTFKRIAPKPSLKKRTRSHAGRKTTLRQRRHHTRGSRRILGSTSSSSSLKKGEHIGKTTIVGEQHVAAWGPGGSLRNKQYEHVKKSLLERGASEKDATRIAAATVNRSRALHGETYE